MGERTTVTHEISKSGNLFFLLNGLNGGLNRLASAIGGGLQAVALALSTPQDNSGAVQAQIDKSTKEMKSSTDALDSAVKAQQQSTKQEN